MELSGWPLRSLCGCLLIGAAQLAFAQQPTTPPDTVVRPVGSPADTTGIPKVAPTGGQEEAKEQNKADFPLDNFYAERKKWPLSFLRHFRFSLSTGYGHTFFSHELPGYGIYQAPGGRPQIFPGTSTGTRYSNWVNERVVDNTAAAGGAFLVSSDTVALGFRGSGWSIPLKATIHFEFMQRYRIGIGYSYELFNMGEFTSTNYTDRLAPMQPTNASGSISRFFGMAGVSFYRAGPYLFTGDIQVGSFSPSNFDATLATTGVYFNGGVTIERDLSEYLRVFVRPSYEFKSFTLTLPEGGNPIDHGMNALYLNVGLTYRIPELPKCFHKDCRIQRNHAHGDREYRSRVHPIYKKQNPNYGENHPNLIKYKGKNKKLLSPY